MSDTVPTQPGQSLRLECIVWDGPIGGTPLDLTGATLSVRESNPAVLKEGVITVTDAAAGKIMLTLTEAQAEQLGEGRVNWFRFEAQFAEDNLVTPKIWINVQ